MYWPGIIAGVVFAVGLFFIIYYYLRNVKENGKNVDMAIDIGKGVTEIAGAVIKAFDKDPNTKSPVEQIYEYGSLAVASVEQSFKKLKAELLANGGNIKALNQTMKAEALAFVDKLAKADGHELTDDERAIIGGIIEASLFFLPKPVFAELVEPEETDSNSSPSDRG
jgi:hypothetical protein